MKIVSKEIDTIVVFKKGKVPIPYKFKYAEGDEAEKREIKIDKIIRTEKKRIAGIDSIIYLCQSYINERIIQYELKYIIGEYRWVLYKR